MNLLPAEVAFDESGNTGDNLLDANQPVCSLASVHIDPGAAAALVAQMLPPDASAGVHHDRLPDYPRLDAD